MASKLPSFFLVNYECSDCSDSSLSDEELFSSSSDMEVDDMSSFCVCESPDITSPCAETYSVDDTSEPIPSEKAIQANVNSLTKCLSYPSSSDSDGADNENCKSATNHTCADDIQLTTKYNLENPKASSPIVQAIQANVRTPTKWNSLTKCLSYPSSSDSDGADNENCKSATNHTCADDIQSATKYNLENPKASTPIVQAIQANVRTPTKWNSLTKCLSYPSSSHSDGADNENCKSATNHTCADNIQSATKYNLENPKASSPIVRNSRSKKYALNVSELSAPMNKFLLEVKTFFLKPVNLQRQKPAIANSTFEKAMERLLCFLGFSKNQLALELTPDLFLRLNVIEQYLTYLKEVRNCSSATMSNHAASLLYPAKYLHREHSPEYRGVEVIRQLRGQVTNLQKLGDTERPSSKEDLVLQNRWLDWDQVVESVSLQRERFDMARSADAKAKEMADLLLLGLYVLIPPSRGMEIRTLEIWSHGVSPKFEDLRGKNTVHLEASGKVTFFFHSYKTKNKYGVDTTIVQSDHELSRLLRDYLKTHRSALLNAKSGNFLLVNSFGAPYSCAAFSGHLKFLFKRLTGINVSINVLRSSFLTHAYSQRDCTDSVKDSLAAALRHTRKQAQDTYDRRSSNEKKDLALSLATEFSRKARDESSQSVGGDSGFKVGDFVGLVEEESTESHPKVLIAQIQSFLPQDQTCLLWFKEMPGREYSFQFDPQLWIESTDSLVLVAMKQIKKKPGFFKLNTSLKTIHRAIHSKR